MSRTMQLIIPRFQHKLERDQGCYIRDIWCFGWPWLRVGVAWIRWSLGERSWVRVPGPRARLGRCIFFGRLGLGASVLFTPPK